MDFVWFSICVQKKKIKFDLIESNEYFFQKVATYLCTILKNEIHNSIVIFDKKDSKKFYLEISKVLKKEFQGNIKKVFKNKRRLYSNLAKIKRPVRGSRLKLIYLKEGCMKFHNLFNQT